MQTENRLFDDLARVASGAINTLGGLREEIELRVKERIERFAAEMDLVSREEFDAVKAMAAKARAEQDALEARIADLEARLGAETVSPKKRAAAKSSPGKGAGARGTAGKRAGNKDAASESTPQSGGAGDEPAS